MMKNIEKYLSLLKDGVDGLLLTSRYSRFYAAEFDIAEGVALVTAKGSRYFTDSRYIEAAQAGVQGMEVCLVDRSYNYHVLLNRAIAELEVTCLGYEEDYLTMGEYLGYEKALNASLKPMQAQINGFRGIKEPWEQTRMKKAQEITDAAFAQVLPKIHAGMTEKELQAELIYCLYRNGADGLSFDPIVVSGPNTSMPHGVPGDRVLQDGDFITMDFGVLYQGYCSDMTRTVALGYATEEMKQLYALVLKAQEDTIAITKAGLTGKQIDEHARNIFNQAGMGQYFTHSYGHSLGMEIHEAPYCNGKSEIPMEAGMVSSAEPGLYIPGKYGVRIEDVVIFQEDGCLNITNSPKNLIIL